MKTQLDQDSNHAITLSKKEVLPIYIKVDGKLVRKENDIRDPKRRYGIVSSPNGNYEVECTDEEEAEADLREAKWLEEAPLRKKQEEENHRKEEEFIASLKYETRYVGFFDILGWSDTVKNSVNNIEMQKKLGLATNAMRLHTEMNEWKKQHGPWPGDAQIVHFSDSIVVSTSADYNGKSEIISILSFLSSALLQHGFLLRGGITKGEIYHKDSSVFGPALNRAYELENKNAVYPRVILDYILTAEFGQGDKVTHEDGTYIGQNKTWRLSNDGFRFFDFLQPFGGSHGFSDTNLLHLNLMKIHSFINERLVEYQEKPSILPKYIWLANYFNEVLKESNIQDIEYIITKEELIICF
ncbi:MAG: hypothetical protein WC656_01080 [Sulfurimonas sp.]|jgi:hypothetical protein